MYALEIINQVHLFSLNKEDLKKLEYFSYEYSPFSNYILSALAYNDKNKLFKVMQIIVEHAYLGPWTFDAFKNSDGYPMLINRLLNDGFFCQEFLSKTLSSQLVHTRF